jgi:hypothetical protein
MEGGAGPAWLSTLLIAESWGAPPWVVLGDAQPSAWGRWKWILRQKELLAQRAKKHKRDSEGSRDRTNHRRH